MAAFTALFSVSAYFVYDCYKQAQKQEELYDNLAAVVESAEDTDSETPVLYTEEKTVLPELAELYLQNSDLAGWICIEDTNINYPVMHTPENPDFYLKHGFDKEYSDYGCPYVQDNCDVQKPSDNVVIYGHHMKNGSMFADLEKFKSKEFWQEHKTISFSTVTDRYEYEIVAVFKTVVYTDSPDSFKYYHFVNAERRKISLLLLRNAGSFPFMIPECRQSTGIS